MNLPYRFYRAATTLFQPAAGPYLARRERAGKEDGARLGERAGRPGRARPPGPLAWIHGASVGEALAILPLVDRLIERGLTVLVTTGTATSAAVLAQRLPPGALHQFVPLDVPAFAARFLAAWRPDLALFVESELWPNLLVETRRRSIPLVLVNARLSERSFARWRRLPGFIGDLLGGATLCLAQTRADGDRLAALGARAVAVPGNLKYDAPPPPADAAELAALAAAVAGRPLWLAASTHVEEEPSILDADRRLRAAHPTLLTIVVPRQPGRGAALAAQAATQGLTARLRSAGDTPAGAGLYVGDTIGELGLFFRLCPTVFVGKSLAGGGGQNPIEPAKLGCAVLHGPQIANFKAVYGLLDAAGGARTVADAAGLAAALDRLLTDPAGPAAMGSAARLAVAGEEGATARVMAALEPLIAPLVRKP